MTGAAAALTPPDSARAPKTPPTYYGACIHVPPPPPNQIVYVKMNSGFKIKSLYDAYWVTGVLRTESKKLPMAEAAYSLNGTAAHLYDYAR
jgi:uncharacterized protein